MNSSHLLGCWYFIYSTYLTKTKNLLLGREVWALSSPLFKRGAPERRRKFKALNKLLLSIPALDGKALRALKAIARSK
jgi:hypothetical protein